MVALPRPSFLQRGSPSSSYNRECMAAARGFTTDQMVELYERLGSVIRAVATHLECSRGSVYKHLNKIGVLGKPLTGGTERATKALHKTVPKRGVKRYLITSAQNNTLMHEANWSNLLALKKYYNAELLVGTYTYNKNAFGKLSVKAGTKAKPETELWYDERLLPYIEDHNVDLAPGLRWCGRMNTLPTATNPLSGFETYTGRKSGIFPHAKHAMQSVPSGSLRTPSSTTPRGRRRSRTTSRRPQGSKQSTTTPTAPCSSKLRQAATGTSDSCKRISMA